jgi:hypothetical protein
MKPENKKFLEENKHHWITLRDAQYLRHLNGNERSGMQRVMSEEFRPGYTADLWCPTCVAEMVKSLYRHYEAWLEKNPDVPIIPEIPVIPPNDPEELPEIPAEPIKVQTGFPVNEPPATPVSNKNHHRK